ncbi:MAG: hypothetical protein RSD27_09665 [Ruthenibacterium sp.]
MSLQVDFDKASWAQSADGFCLQLFVKNKPAALRFLDGMKENRTYTAELKEYHARRSLDANAYFWVLCDKLAVATNLPKTELYRNAIRDIGGNSETVCVRNEAAGKLADGWTRNGIGWFCEAGESKLSGCTNVTLYYGSSTYDTKQMARLIDNIVQDCEAVGIETKTPEELARLVREWDGAHG